MPNFYPRSPCGERLIWRYLTPKALKFLSTLSLRRATESIGTLRTVSVISIHALLAESDYQRKIDQKSSSISIHALLAESDVLKSAYYSPPPNFYPRSPCGERRLRQSSNIEGIKFLSTLSLRRATICRHEMLRKMRISIHALLAESDGQKDHANYHPLISIHALLAESDIGPLIFSVQPRNFYPRSPCGERL